MKKKTGIVAVSHISESYGPIQAMMEYLTSRQYDFTLIMHSLFSHADFTSCYSVFKGGSQIDGQKNRMIKGPDACRFIKQFITTIAIILCSGRHYHLYIGMNNLNCLAGIILRWLRRVELVIFFNVDYSPKRFRSAIPNYIYRQLDIFCTRRADRLWVVTERIASERERQGAHSEDIQIVPNTVNLDHIPKEVKKRKKILVFVGHLTQTKGVQTLVNIFPLLAKNVPELTLTLIGGGPYESKLRQLIHAKGLDNRVSFLGYTSYAEMLSYLKQCSIGFAPYTEDDSYTYYCDPSKVKAYLACGCPVIVSDVPEIAKKVVEQKAGIAYNREEEIIRFTTLLLSDEELLQQYKENALKLANEFGLRRVFDRVFETID